MKFYAGTQTFAHIGVRCQPQHGGVAALRNHYAHVYAAESRRLQGFEQCFGGQEIGCLQVDAFLGIADGVEHHQGDVVPVAHRTACNELYSSFAVGCFVPLGGDVVV